MSLLPKDVHRAIARPGMRRLIRGLSEGGAVRLGAGEARWRARRLTPSPTAKRKAVRMHSQALGGHQFFFAASVADFGASFALQAEP